VGFKDPLSGITLSAADITAGAGMRWVCNRAFQKDKNNWAPRLAVAWDVRNNAKTVVRAGFGLFYDHPAVGRGASIRDIADAVQQQQGILIPGKRRRQNY